MNREALRTSVLVVVGLTLSVLSPSLGAQDPTPQIPGQAAGSTRESMWPAPTTADWERPVLITFQRTWEDAVAVSRETQRPILVCVNMDGEPASEHYAGIRYRQPEVAKLYEPYVCVIASVYRHTPRDHDEHGNRIPCPRFGSVTCGEHIAIEPFLYEKFMEGQRVAPRHIMVELDGSESYDVFYAMDTRSVFQQIHDGIANRAITPPVVVRGDRPVIERVASHDIADRLAVESAFANGDATLRKALLDAAAAHPEAAPLDLLRLAIFGLDADLARRAREALAKTDSENAVDLLAAALSVPLDAGEREGLVAALERLGANSTRAKTLAVVNRGLTSRSKDVDVEGWSKAIDGGSAYAPPPDWNTLEARLDSQASAANKKPDDATAKLELAEASLALAVDPKTTQVLGPDRRTATAYAKLMFEDARRAAEEARQLGATGSRVEAVLALTAYYLGETDKAYEHAETAMRDMPANPQDWNAIATLALFAQARQQAIWKALRAKTDWPKEWLTDVNAAYSVLARHPLGTDQHAVAHYDFLRSLGAGPRAARVIDAALQRFPDSWPVHDRLRERILDERGADGLEPAYADLLAAPGASKNLEWFAGYASLVAAEFARRAGDAQKAVGAYERAVAHYERAIAANPDSRPTADHYVALAIAGRARIAFEAGEYDRAIELVLEAFARKPDAAASMDGMNISPVDTAKLLLARLKELDRGADAARVQAGLDQLDPKMLELPEYERNTGGPRGRRGRRGG